MAGLPTGTVTFLFTDIEGSTRLWEQFPAEMSAAVARHDALLRELIDRHNGQVFKTVGDAFCSAFSSADEALAAALDSQLRLHDEFPTEAVCPIRVRIALHTGSAEERNDDYFGPAVNRVARVLSAGFGGQILLSGAAGDAISARPDDTSLRDLGLHQLKDLLEPERIFQLCHPTLPNEFPELKTLQKGKHNLPCQVTSFIGRDQEMADVKRLLSTTRLLTLTGSGGTGKTRLSLQAAAEVAEEYPDGVWLVELGALDDPNLIAQATAAVLQVREESGGTLERALSEELRKKRLLLILDNCEHLVEASARLAESVIRSCPDVRILASSREPLMIVGEAAYRVPSLNLPEYRPGRGTAELNASGAIQLFRDRASAMLSSFEITPENAEPVVAICRRLDGIPLAIELAAARIRSMPVQQIAERLDDRFSLLTRGSRTALPRQQTLRGLIDWSWDLLAMDEQTLWSRLSVFNGGWTLEAAEAVCTPKLENQKSKIENQAVLDLLCQLVDKSLVFMEERNGAARYHMLETVRQYGLERLREAGQEDAVRAAHFDWSLALAKQAEPHFSGPDMKEWLDRTELEHDNMRSALTHAPTQDGRLELAAALHRFWFVRGYLTEGRMWLERGLSGATDADLRLRAKGLNAAGILAWQKGELDEAQERFAECLSLCEERGDADRVAACLNNLGLIAKDRGDLETCRARYERAAEIYRARSDRLRLGITLANLGAALIANRMYQEASIANDEFLTIAESVGDPWCLAQAWNNVGEIAFQRGEFDQALAQFRKSLRANAEIRDKLKCVGVLIRLAEVALAMGNYADAPIALAHAMRIQQDTGCILSDEDFGALERARADLRCERGDAPLNEQLRIQSMLSSDDILASLSKCDASMA